MAHYHTLMRIIRTTYQIFFIRFSFTQKISIGFLSVARRFEGITSIINNMTPPPLDHNETYMVD